MIRIPGGGRFEFRLADGATNPYLLPAALLAAGLDGIARGIDPGQAARHRHVCRRPQGAGRHQEAAAQSARCAAHRRKNRSCCAASSAMSSSTPTSSSRRGSGTSSRHLTDWERPTRSTASRLAHSRPEPEDEAAWRRLGRLCRLLRVEVSEAVTAPPGGACLRRAPHARAHRRMAGRSSRFHHFIIHPASWTLTPPAIWRTCSSIRPRGHGVGEPSFRTSSPRPRTRLVAALLAHAGIERSRAPALRQVVHADDFVRYRMILD